jgi:hypothetical protein
MPRLAPVTTTIGALVISVFGLHLAMDEAYFGHGYGASQEIKARHIAFLVTECSKAYAAIVIQ